MKQNRIYEDNRGKFCKNGCGHKARIKGLCNECYKKQRNKNNIDEKI
jgi:NMD protein affecting ribosome stability and mRNA decay